MLSTSILYCNKIDEPQRPAMPHRILQHPNGFSVVGGGGDVCESGTVIDVEDDDDEEEEEEAVVTDVTCQMPKNLVNSRPALIPQNPHQHPPSTSFHPSYRMQYLKLPLASSSASSMILNGSAITNSSNASKSILTNGNSRFRVQYIGCNTCDYRQHKPENGIGIYQKPMLDLYATVLKRSVVLRSLLTVNQVADLSSHGIFIAEKDRFQQQQPQPQQPQPQQPHQPQSLSAGRSTSHHHRTSSSASSTSKHQPSPQPSLISDTVVTKVITPLSNILLWAAVRLQHRTQMKKLKNSAIKKRHIGVAFVPLSCSEAVLDKNAFVTLNSKQRFLLGITHPPLFVCVLQKVTSAQRLECHMFVCRNGDDAIQMCNRMDQLRQQSQTIGHLHLPPPGGMGKYFYQNHNHHNSSPSLLSTTRTSASSLMSTSLLTSRSYSPSQRTMSEEQSTIMTSSRAAKFSDIEEEEVDDGNVVAGVETITNGQKQQPIVVKKLIDNYQSNVVDTNVGIKGIKMIINNHNGNSSHHHNHHNHNHNHHGGGHHQMMMAMMMINNSNSNSNNNNKLKCDARLFDRTRRMITTKVTGNNNNNNNHPHLMNGGNVNGNVNGVNGGDCPSELSSIISSKISISSNNLDRKQQQQRERERELQSSMLQQQVAPSMMAQRDYRFESYKANNHPEDNNDGDDGNGGGCGNKSINTPNSSIKLIKSSSNHHHNHNHHNHNTTDIIGNNGGVGSKPEQFQHQRINHDHRSINNDIVNIKANNNNDENENDDLNDDDVNDLDVYDELHKNRLFAKAAAKVGMKKNLNSNSNLEPVAPSGGEKFNQQIQNDRIKNQNKKKTYLFGDSLRSRQRRKHLSTNMDLLHQSLLANGNKDDPGTVANGTSKLKNHSIISSSIFLDNESDEKSTSKESSVNGQQQKARTKNRTNASGPPKSTETEAARLPRSEKEMDKPLKLYLPPSAMSETNLGVKGFNKSSRVEQWSTMVADPNITTATTISSNNNGTNGRPLNNSCDLCQMELNCDECCQFCQAIEQYKQKYCQKCHLDQCGRLPLANDDFLLDETTLKHFNMNSRDNGSIQPPRHPHPDAMYYHVPRTRSGSNTTGVTSSDVTLFNRIRRFSWQSLFGSRKKFQGSRLWNRFRSGSQRLRGSRRFFQNKSRIFLPTNTNCTTNGTCCTGNQSRPESIIKKKTTTTTMAMGLNPYSYDEHYLKPPARQQRLLEPVFSTRKSSLLSQKPKKKNGSSTPFYIDDHQDDYPDDGGKQFYGFDTSTNKKIIETNNQDKFIAANNDHHHNVKQNNKKKKKNGDAMQDHVDDEDEDADADVPVETKIKPFFISHPGIEPSQAIGDTNSGQPPPPQQQQQQQQNGISISSDSGMEEYDCHSSAEHSPSGFHNNGQQQQQQQPQQQLLHKQQQQNHQKLRRTTMANNGKYHNFQQQQSTGRLKQLEQSTQQNVPVIMAANSKKPPTTTKMILQSSTMKYSKDLRRQAGHWSNTNLENQLGYMP